MPDLDDVDNRILQSVKQAQEDAEPFEREIDGISYEDIKDEFTNEDFDGVNPEVRLGFRLHRLYEQGCLVKTFEAANNPDRYRLPE